MPTRGSARRFAIAARSTLACVCTLALAGCQPDVLRFVVIADPHVDLLDPSRSARFEAAIEAVIEAVNRLSPRFAVICGDLVEHPGDASERAELHRILDGLDAAISLHVLPGNHDIGAAPTQPALEAWRAEFGPDRYIFEHDGVAGVVLDSAIIKHTGELEHERDAQLRWLRETVPGLSDGAARVFVFLHHPPFLRKPDELGTKDNLGRTMRRPYVRLFEEHGVSAVFSGHFHREQRSRSGAVEFIATGSIGKPFAATPPGYRVVSVYDDRFEDEYVAVGDFAARSNLR